MVLDLRPRLTVTGRRELLACDDCAWDAFSRHANAIVRAFGMTVLERIDAPGDRLWIVRLGDARFCIAWDDWLYEVTVMAWGDTPDDAVFMLSMDR